LGDDFVELYNNTDSPLLVTTTDGSKGWAVAASDGVVRFVVPAGTVIPARGHFLGVNTLGYSLSGYPAGNDGTNPTTANGDATAVLDAVSITQRDDGNVVIENASFEASGDAALATGIISPKQVAGWSAAGTVGVTLGALVIAVAPDNFTALANVAPVTAAIGWAYYVLFESSPARGTLGKIALNLFVGDVHGDPISYRRAAFRYLFKIFSTLLLGLGWFMAAFTPRKQALHDVMAGTLVLRRVTYLVTGQEPPTEPGDYWDGGRWVASVRSAERSS